MRPADTSPEAWQVWLDLVRKMSPAERLQRTGTSVEVVDPRTLYPLDLDAILESVAKTSPGYSGLERVIGVGKPIEIAVASALGLSTRRT